MSQLKKSSIIIVIMLLAVGLGYLIGSQSASSQQASPEHQHPTQVEQKTTLWTCSMHPQIKLPKAGKCPICFMDLIPLDNSSGDDEGAILTMSESALALAEVETMVLEREEAEVVVDMVGKIAVDTTRISDIALLADAEIRQLFVNYAGIPVKKGEHLAELYSPDVYSAAQDLLVAIQSQSVGEDLKKSAELKLKLLGVPQDFVETILREQVVPETYILRSPSDGFVEDLSGYQGMWIKKGQMLCRVIDMKSLWAELDAYESDIPWIRYGQLVSIKAEALAGQVIEGTVSYIPARLDDRSRTVKIRVQIDNSKNLLKPGMFVSAELKARVTGQGKVTSPELKGKWISPMHPEIVKNGPGLCDVCGMDLVPAEELGFSYDASDALPLLLPETAVLITGKRAVVYVRIPGEKPVFEGREVLLGPKAGHNFVVLDGLKEGERVVVKGNFKIDSALQIQAKPSMMSMNDQNSKSSSSLKDSSKKNSHQSVVRINNSALKDSLEDFMNLYLEISEKLAKDDFSDLPELGKRLKGELDYADYTKLNKTELKVWNQLHDDLIKSMERIHHATDIEAFREIFQKVSSAVVSMVEIIGTPTKNLNLMYCPMVDAPWLQKDEAVSNPYYGASMLRCGELKKSWSSSVDQPQ